MKQMQKLLEALQDAEESAFYAATNADASAEEKEVLKAQDIALRAMIAELSHMIN